MQDRLSTNCQKICNQVNQLAATQGETLLMIAQQLSEVFANGGLLILAGSGPLQAVAQQTALAFSHRLGFERPPLPAIALGNNPLFTTALLAEEKAQEALSREYRSFCEQEHMLLIFSSQQPSPQIADLLSQIEDQRTLVNIGPNTKNGWLKDQQPSLNITLDQASPARLSELGLICGHLICELVEGELFGV